MIEKISLRKNLIKTLKIEISFGELNQKSFNGFIFTPHSDGSIEVETPTGDILSQNIESMSEQWLKVFCNKSSFSKDKVPMKKKPRKKKKHDIILNEFMGHLHTCECAVDGCPNTNIEAHHVIGRQPHRYDILCVPLCVDHHRGSEYSWHEGNVRKFRKEYSKDILAKKAMHLLLEWLNDYPTLPASIDENKLRFIAEKIIESESSVNQVVKDAIIEYENEYDF